VVRHGLNGHGLFVVRGMVSRVEGTRSVLKVLNVMDDTTMLSGLCRIV
jgi:NADH:ubiquinone oxidoreductase subunit 4 (subunit M)